MKGETKLNAIRSGLVVLGVLVFGYLTLEIGFKPILVKAQEEERQKQLEPLPSDDSQPTNPINFPEGGEGELIEAEKLEPCFRFLQRENFLMEISESISPEHLQPVVKIYLDALDSSSVAVEAIRSWQTTPSVEESSR